MNKRILWITRTAVMLALLVVAQYIGKALGANQLITGSLVNIMLLLSVALGGAVSGATIALLSPLFAVLIGVGPALIQLTPVIMIGNLIYVVVFYFIYNFAAKKDFKANLILDIIGFITSAVLKYGFLTLSVQYAIVPLFMKNDPVAKANKIIAMFSLPQLFTALIGGAIAITLLPILKKAIKK